MNKPLKNKETVKNANPSKKWSFPTKFDYYSASIFDQNPDYIIAEILNALPQANGAQCRPQKSYQRGHKIARDDQEFCVVSYGGSNTGVHVETKSNAEYVVPQIKRWAHQVSRVDSCIDVVEPFFFEWANDELVRAAKRNNITLDQVGDWERAKGRTRYVGSRKSMVQVCLYEKGYQMKSDPDWVRVEVRIRPQKKEQKLWAAGLESEQVFKLPAFMQTFNEVIGKRYIDNIQKTMWKPTDTLSARYHLIKQYKQTIGDLVKEAGGWSEFGNIFEAATESIENGDIPAETMRMLKPQKDYV